MHFLLTLIIQIGVILVTARVVGLLFRKIHQPQVVGEMVAGILLGPSLLGWLAPEVSAVLFPLESLGYLNALSQVGLLLFMFLIGLELDLKLLRGRGEAAVITSHVSIVAPFFLGSMLALYLYPRLSDETVSFTEFALFMGAAMSVTAFPVLARILSERNLLQTKVGALTIACAAVDDVTAWCILALVVAIVRANEAALPVWVTIFGSILYIAFLVLVVRHGLRRLATYYHSSGRLTQDMTAVILLLLLASAYTTEWLGIHALFGAFAIGAVMPKDRDFVRELTEKLEHVTVVFLLPLFFAFTGLRTSIGLLSGAEMWFFCGIILFVAVAGKFGGSSIAARLSGLGWREAGALGILMNTRGLMELVILSIGLELGVISQALFTMMVIMAVVTTFMTTPVLEWIYPVRLIRREQLEVAGEREAYTVLIPVSLSSSGPGLLRVAQAVGSSQTPHIYALHLYRAGEHLMSDFTPGRRNSSDEALQPLLDTATEFSIEVRPLSFVTRNPAKDILDVAQEKGADLILMGWHKPIVTRSILSGTVNEVMRWAKADVAVYVERQFRPWRRILVPFREGLHDRGALDLAVRISRNVDAEITILHVVEPGSVVSESGVRTTLSDLSDRGRIRLQVVESVTPLDTAVEVAQQGFDLIVVGISETWGLEPSMFSHRHERLARESPGSLLIVRKSAVIPMTTGEMAETAPVAYV